MGNRECEKQLRDFLEWLTVKRQPEIYLCEFGMRYVPVDESLDELIADYFETDQ